MHLKKCPSSLNYYTTDKTHSFVHLSFNSTLQLLNGISNDLQNLLRYFNGTVIVAFFRIPLLPSATVVPNNLALYLKDLKLLLSLMTVCYYHVRNGFQSESTLFSCLNVKEFPARNRRDI